MGAYTKEKIGQDFAVSARGEIHNTIVELELIAIEILSRAPDNECRDFAISHLLQAAQFIALSLIEKRVKGD